MIEQLLQFTLILVGLVYLFTRSAIMMTFRVAILGVLSRFRTVQAYFGTLIYCAGCAGFWLGAALSTFYQPWSGANWIESAIVAMSIATTWDYLTVDGRSFQNEVELWDPDYQEVSDDGTQEDEDE